MATIAIDERGVPLSCGPDRDVTPCCIKAVRRNRGQCHCFWCGRRPSHEGCPVDEPMRAAIRGFAVQHGRTWKSKLREVWMLNQDADRPELRRVRNIIGPSGLDRITLRMIVPR